MPKNTLSKFKPIQKLIEGVGKDVKKYFIEEKEHCGDKILLLIESEKGER